MWKKYCTAGQATDDNMAHAHCMLDTYGYKHTLNLCNAYCFSTATVVAGRRLHTLPVLLTSQFVSCHQKLLTSSTNKNAERIRIIWVCYTSSNLRESFKDCHTVRVDEHWRMSCQSFENQAWRKQFRHAGTKSWLEPTLVSFTPVLDRHNSFDVWRLIVLFSNSTNKVDIRLNTNKFCYIH